MSEHEELKAECRGCGLELRGKPYYMGGSANHPRTGERCKVNFYGGYVCSRECDFRSSLRQENSMPGHSGSESSLGCYSRESFQRNWAQEASEMAKHAIHKAEGR